ncbi:predicted protein [Streptomyces viridosporus ATCC 14672]|uniref:Predicted protein n=1 Tax=Streptomyces viridosporus (strain ATCC 14672 / DSM 40746 / JCM 4963 / KCTC 9882 / NRRL B-12104 / FH 1290) TaxID=566461 RepID=D5ZUA3_STRV1|nr:predicted protein [Streptomyces viridosporus ATCC 14672]
MNAHTLTSDPADSYVRSDWPVHLPPEVESRISPVSERRGSPIAAMVQKANTRSFHLERTFLRWNP